LRSIPGVGSSIPPFRYVSSWRMFRNAPSVLRQGCTAHRIFRVPMWSRWLVVVSGVNMNEELRKMPEEVMSAREASKDVINARYTIGHKYVNKSLEIPVIRGPLTRSIGIMIPSLFEEIQLTFAEMLGTKNEWIEIMVLPVLTQITSRVINRAIVGVPYCEDTKYQHLVTNYANDTMKSKLILDMIPVALHRWIGPCLPWMPKARRLLADYLNDEIDQRNKRLDSGYSEAEWASTPDDVLMWLMKESRKCGLTVDYVIQGVLSINFAAIHTSSMSIVHSLLYIATDPDSTRILRNEIAGIVSQEGWSQSALDKIDSFMRESDRMNGPSLVSMFRKTMSAVTMSDGTVIPPGLIVTASTAATHYDERLYEEPYLFKPFRFYERRQNPEEACKHQYHSTSAEFITFGHGRGACSGRFFAAYVIKLLLACILHNYDVTISGTDSRPKNQFIGTVIMPSSSAKILIRKRDDFVA
ncbi:cytochrome P450, partial [Wolfiporia cocos MD-104 SS10]